MLLGLTVSHGIQSILLINFEGMSKVYCIISVLYFDWQHEEHFQLKTE